jgi:hypothetical protein
MSYLQRANRQHAHGIRNELRRGHGQRQRAERKLDGNFPGTGGREVQLGRGGGQQIVCCRVQFVLSAQTPKEDTRIQQIFHFLFFGPFVLPSKAARRSSGKGTSKSSGTVISPTKAPSFRLVSESRTGTNRATGTPRFAMVISSPAATRRRRRENWVWLHAYLRLSSCKNGLS